MNSAAAGAAVWKRSGGGADGPLLRGCGARGAGGAVAGCGEALEALDALSAARLLADLVDAPAAARTRKSGIQPGNFCCSAALESPAPVDLRRLGRSESGVFFFVIAYMVLRGAARWAARPARPPTIAAQKPLTSLPGACKIRGSPAQVAELVDALASGASGGNFVEVRVLFWAPV
ncbi:hypothetical protein XAC1566 [Xanthomonas citri pv. citri str. 306]|uniref:Uncharacterized protein n=1 Tax=Xanthomonas axonopodis pv. citri (strain 306) TaxID=190486 RepID=A0AAI8ES30_XANAC|nr:hypothetical protein XAC1566 [Xanthomonas citri pv. citri str. 306]